MEPSTPAGQRAAELAVRKGLIPYLKAIGAIKTFNSFGLASKITLAFMFLLGWVALAFFWTTDVGFDIRIGSWDVKRFGWLRTFDENWMHTHAYAPNILAGVTGFLIGAPVAVVILSGFTTQREDNAALARVNRLSALAWDSFRDSVNAFATDQRYELIVDQARDIKKYYDETTVTLNEYIAKANEVLGTPESDSLKANLQKLKQIEVNFRAAVNALRQNINFFQTEDEWAQVVGAWRVLDQYVRLQRLEQGLEWFNDTSDSGLRKWMGREGNPLQDLLNAIEIRRYTQDMPPSVETMALALDTLRSYAGMDDASGLGEWLIYESNIFMPERSKAYHIKRDASQTFILDLRRYIGLAEMEYWPRAQKVPKPQNAEREPINNEALGFLGTPEGQKRLEKLLKRAQRKQIVNRALYGVKGRL